MITPEEYRRIALAYLVHSEDPGQLEAGFDFADSFARMARKRHKALEDADRPKLLSFAEWIHDLSADLIVR